MVMFTRAGSAQPAGRRRRLLALASSLAGDAVAGGVPVVVDDGDLPAGAGRAGRRGGEVTGQGRVEGAEQPVVAGPGRGSLEGGQRDRYLGQHRVVPSGTRAVVPAARAVAVTRGARAAGVFVAGVAAVAVRSPIVAVRLPVVTVASVAAVVPAGAPSCHGRQRGCRPRPAGPFRRRRVLDRR